MAPFPFYTLIFDVKVFKYSTRLAKVIWVVSIKVGGSSDPIGVGIEKQVCFPFLSILDVKMVDNIVFFILFTHITLARRVFRDLNLEDRTRNKELASFLSF